MSPADERFFFVHIMKTAGYSLVSMLKDDVFDSADVYPTPADRDFGIVPYLSIDYVRFVLPERKNVRLFAGHFPFAMRDLLGPHVRTIAFFRDPVERVLSHLRYARYRDTAHRGWPLHRIYNDIHESAIDNLQTRTFCLDRTEGVDTLLKPMTLTEQDYARAVSNLEQLDFIGLSERFYESAALLERRFGWRFGNFAFHNKSPALPRGDHLRPRIERDNAFDRRLYDHVTTLYERQRDALQHGTVPDAAG